MANKHDYPNVCGLLWTTDSGRRVGTGFLIGPRHVLTVGHNIYDPLLNAPPHLARAMEAYFPGAAPGQERRIAATRIDTLAGWKIDAHSSQRHLSAYDVGIVVLEEAPSATPFALEEPDGPEFLGVVGYPKEASSTQSGLFRSVGAFIEPNVACPDPNFAYRLYYPPMYSPPTRIEGMSGGPAYRVADDGMPIRDAAGRVLAVGVHSSWVRFGDTLLASAVVLYESEILETIRTWLQN